MKKAKQSVLFQKLGNQWFIFTESDGKTIYTALPKGVNPKKTKFDFVEVTSSNSEERSRPESDRAA